MVIIQLYYGCYICCLYDYNETLLGIVWNPHTVSDINIIEAVQKRAARWIWNSSTYSWDKSYDDCLRELNWPTLARRYHYYMIDYIHSMLRKRNLLSFVTLTEHIYLILYCMTVVRLYAHVQGMCRQLKRLSYS